MNLSEEELEKELAALKPAQPSQRLETKIEEQLNSSDPSTGLLIRLWPVVAVAAAACLALVLVLRNQSTETPKSVAEATVTADATASGISPSPFGDFQPIEAEQRLIEAIDDGVVLVVDDEPVRRLRYQFIDTVTMVNETDGSVFTMEIPREETLFVPVSLL